MLSRNDQLIELVRRLEEQRHVFASDPLLITEKLQKESGNPHDKLFYRASRIDSNGKLTQTLSKIDSRIKAVITLLSLIWCVSGFLGLFTLLNSNVVNFFYALVSLLGLHTLMLVVWLVLTAKGMVTPSSSPSVFASLVSPKQLIRGDDSITQAAVDLYEAQLQHTGMRWYLGKISHQLWLATLTGMLLALVALFMVKDYQFAWESTLLSANTIAHMVDWLAWLPDKSGFATPSSEQILQSQQFAQSAQSNAIRSYEWAMLLIGSLLLYGIVPRALAYLLCVLMFARKKMRLDLSLPYYQKILTFWSRQVTDADDFVEKIQPAAPKAQISRGKKLIVTLERSPADEHWYQFVAGHDIDDFGVLDDRDDMDRLLQYLDTHDVQVLLGVMMPTLPDRGVMRKLDKIAQHAKQGLVVQLLTVEKQTQEQTQDKSDDTLTEQYHIRQQQWQTALAERQIALVSVE